MKKLFLYTAAVVYLFWSGFMIFHEIYSNKEYKFKQVTTETEDYGNVTETSAVRQSYNPCNIGEYVGSASVIEFNAVLIPSYTVGIKDGAVVVFDENNEVYEYTGVDADLIESLNYELYQKIEEGLTFDSEEDLYIFLESVSS